MNKDFIIFLNNYMNNKFLNIIFISHTTYKYEFEIFDDNQNKTSGEISFKLGETQFTKPNLSFNYNPNSKYFIILNIHQDIREGFNSKSVEKKYTFFFDEQTFLSQNNNQISYNHTT